MSTQQDDDRSKYSTGPAAELSAEDIGILETLGHHVDEDGRICHGSGVELSPLSVAAVLNAHKKPGAPAATGFKPNGSGAMSGSKMPTVQKLSIGPGGKIVRGDR